MAWQFKSVNNNKKKIEKNAPVPCRRQACPPEWAPLWAAPPRCVAAQTCSRVPASGTCGTRSGTAPSCPTPPWGTGSPVIVKMIKKELNLTNAFPFISYIKYIQWHAKALNTLQIVELSKYYKIDDCQTWSENSNITGFFTDNRLMNENYYFYINSEITLCKSLDTFIFSLIS